MNTFEKLYNINVNEKTEKRKGDNGKELTYLSWAYAIAEIKKLYPDMQYEIKKFENNLPYVYDPLTGYMVFTSVTIDGLTHEMWLPVMNSNNRAMKSEPYEYTTKYGTKTVEAATMFDINKTIMRCLTKNLGMFGLGLYIYAGEDLPEIEQNNENVEPKSASKPNNSTSKTEFITLAQKEELRNKIGGKAYSEEMNACGGKMSIENYEKLMAQKGVNNDK